MEGLPKLPGLDFPNLKLNHHVPHTLNFKNGFRIPTLSTCGIGDDPSNSESLAFTRAGNDSTLFDPVLTYGRVKQPPIPPFKPHFVMFDKMALTFFAFFKQSVPESPIENYRIRHVKIIYFLEDNSITVMEPCVRNSGYDAGRLVRRSKIPKTVGSDYLTFKDLNIGIDVGINGIVFHITDCDPYTKEFMLSQGIELNEVECTPTDAVTTDRMINTDRKVRKTPPNDDKLRRFLEYQGKVLHFDCVLDETDRPHGECLTYKMYYFLEDDTISIKELKENREGRQRFPMLLKRTKLPKNFKRQPVTYPAVFLELSNAEVNEYYQPIDLKVGETIFIFGRRFLLLDCDKFTRKYYSDVLKQPQGPRLALKFPEKCIPTRPLPDYIGLGTPEDSLQSIYSLRPKTPKKDVITYLLNANKSLRYGCVLDNINDIDRTRKFILSYSLADGTIKIKEPVIRNSGCLGGKFLGSQRVWRPGCDPNNPEYYGPKDFYIGANLIINDHRFKIVSADLYVYRYMQEHPELFNNEVIDIVRNYLLQEGTLKEKFKDELLEACHKELSEHTNAPNIEDLQNTSVPLEDIIKQNIETKNPEKRVSFVE